MNIQQNDKKTHKRCINNVFCASVLRNIIKDQITVNKHYINIKFVCMPTFILVVLMPILW